MTKKATAKVAPRTIPAPSAATALPKPAPVIQHPLLHKVLSDLEHLLVNVLAHLRTRRNGPFVGSGDWEKLKQALKEEAIKFAENDPTVSKMEGKELHDFINAEIDKIKK